VIAAWGVLEWTFAVLLAVLTAAVGAFALYLAATLFINPARRAHR
jgi:phage shock protein PspC (stress-responsive transcriptional regulator)